MMDFDSASHSDPGGEEHLANASLESHYGCHMRGGHRRTNVPHKTPDEFIQAVGADLGDRDSNPDDAGHERVELASELFSALARICVPQKAESMRPRDVLFVVGGKFVTLLSRIRGDLVPSSLRTEANIADACRLTRAAISRRVTVMSDELGFHLGLRRPSARKKFAEVQRAMYRDGRRVPRGPDKGKLKKRQPPTKPKSSRR